MSSVTSFSGTCVYKLLISSLAKAFWFLISKFDSLLTDSFDNIFFTTKNFSTIVHYTINKCTTLKGIFISNHSQSKQFTFDKLVFDKLKLDYFR